jgi:hypothetical protein
MGENPQKIGMLENLRKLSHHFASVSTTQPWLQQKYRIYMDVLSGQKLTL